MQYTQKQVRDALANGVQAPYESENSNSAQVNGRIEFWTTALSLDDGELLDSMGLTGRANAEIEKYTYFRDHNEFEDSLTVAARRQAEAQQAEAERQATLASEQ